METENNLKNKNVETYLGDMVKVVGDNKDGVVKKLIHGEEEHELEKKESASKSNKDILMFLTGLAMIIAASILLFFLFSFKQRVNISPVITQSGSIIFTDQSVSKPIDGLTKERVAEVVFNQVSNTGVKIGGMEAIYLTENNIKINFARFVSLIKSELDQIHISVIDEDFLIGAMSKENNPSRTEFGEFFILLKTLSFDDVFPVMKIWEKNMFRDLSGFLGINVSSSTNYLFTKDWEDSVILNKNARVLKDQAGDIVLMYIFVTDEHVLITNSEMATKEVMIRLTTSQVKR